MSATAYAHEVAEWTGGRLVAGDPGSTFDASVIDSRAVSPGTLFVAIVGPNHDAHRFLAAVIEAGAAGMLVQRDRVADRVLEPLEAAIRASGAFVVEVEDTTRALAALAAGHRAAFDGPLIGITGSNGKTTTKELCAGILDRVAPTLATTGNLNNNFGVPLTLLRREAVDRFAIVEMGMNHRGEIAELAAIARPTIGVLTNVGTAHIEFLGSREAIAEEKGDLLAALPEDGVAVVGRDDPMAFAQAKRTAARVLSFGRHAEADLRVEGVRFLDRGAFAFSLATPYGNTDIIVPGLSETIVENAVAAAGGALAAGASLEDVAIGLSEHAGVPGRMQPCPLPGGVLAIDDTYNANPQSMRMAIETLARLDTSGARLVALGAMGELGAAAHSAHRELGQLAAEFGIDGLYVFASGETRDLAQAIADGALAAGFPADQIKVEETHTALADHLQNRLSKGDRLLVKGSRAARMERVIESLSATARGAGEENHG